MAIEMTNELRAKLISARAEEVESILAEAGVEATQVEIDRFKFEIDRAAEHDGERISLDELDAVSGGSLWDYFYDRDGCFATVEYGSDCTLNDGGCDLLFNNYFRGPVNVQCSCGRYMFKYGLAGEPGSLHGVLKCPYCKNTIDVDMRVFTNLEATH